MDTDGETGAARSQHISIDIFHAVPDPLEIVVVNLVIGHVLVVIIIRRNELEGY